MKKQVKIESCPELPTDVMLEIFSRVPARSVGRFRTLSKRYYGLLSQPLFIKDHLRHGGSVNKLIVHKMCHPDMNHFLYYPLQDDSSSGVIEPDKSDVYYPSKEFLVGSCNGLFCTKDKASRVFKLWNPTTRELDCLPKLQDTNKFNCFRKSLRGLLRFNYYSFGYDSMNDDYKIVWIVCVFIKDSVETPLSNTTYIYSQRNRCWKEIEQVSPPYCIPYDNGHNCQFLHGKVHWLAYTSQDEKGVKQSQFIASLDLATEKYGIVPLPPSDHPSDDLDVCVLGGELCFYINPKIPSFLLHYDKGFEMWIMREYGVEQSWFRLFTTPLQNLPRNLREIYRVRPLFVMKNGEILFNAKGYVSEAIYLYNPKSCNFIRVNQVLNSKDEVYGHIYVESLVKTTICNKGQSFLDCSSIAQ